MLINTECMTEAVKRFHTGDSLKTCHPPNVEFKMLVTWRVIFIVIEMREGEGDRERNTKG